MQDGKELFLVAGAGRHGAANHLFGDHGRRGHGVEEQPANRDDISCLERTEAGHHLILLGFELRVGEDIHLDRHNPRVLEEHWQSAQSECLWVAAGVDGSDSGRDVGRLKLHLVDGNHHIRGHAGGSSGGMQADFLPDHEICGGEGETRGKHEAARVDGEGRWRREINGQGDAHRKASHLAAAERLFIKENDLEATPARIDLGDRAGKGNLVRRLKEFHFESEQGSVRLHFGFYLDDLPRFQAGEARGAARSSEIKLGVAVRGDSERGAVHSALDREGRLVNRSDLADHLDVFLVLLAGGIRCRDLDEANRGSDGKIALLDGSIDIKVHFQDHRGIHGQGNGER